MTVRQGLLALLLLAGIAVPADAHRLDEYLQALRLRVEPSRIVVEVDVTPGSSIAPEVIALIDRDANRVISPAEAAAYASVAVAEILMEVDGRPTPLTLSRVEAPSPGEIAEGVGTIQITALADVPHSIGRHHVRVSNQHRRDGSVYLANALVPQAPAIRIVEQRRDASQRTFALDYEVRAMGLSQVMWLFGAGASLTSLLVSRKGILRVSRAHGRRACA